MADEVFALSPISARAAMPSEDDYAAISEAFMETSRGRWFLTEYAKRNRNADTRMVLDAVARIEQSLAAHKEEALQSEESLQREESLRQEASLAAQERAAAAAAAAAAEDSLAKALAAIRGAVAAAQESASEALDSLALEQRLAPVRKGARVLREIAWRLREIGNDGRICDLIDSQVTVIEKGAEQISSDQATAALSAAFAMLEGQLEQFGDPHRAHAPDTDTATVVETREATSAPDASGSPVEALAGEAKTGPHMEDASNQEARASPLDGNNAGLSEAALAEAEVEFAAADASATTAPDGDTADADDDAVLDMIAMEMGAPDPIDDEEIAAAVAESTPVHAPTPAEPAVVVAAKPTAAPIVPPVQEAVEPAPAVAKAEPAPPADASLGSTLIARGMLRKPAHSANDALAPIRRMSQAERIAFFS